MAFGRGDDTVKILIYWTGPTAKYEGQISTNNNELPNGP